ncbi:uncharacterized protein LOC131935322 [Physella acuta]|uniref:uncharacterized protein LOC131935322 n=1 Tax=Physella acuta TaxID=109671 RepID=UPI0027DE5862|nr:uncharacterized protein LOC131935322 [Physella acuta]
MTDDFAENSLEMEIETLEAIYINELKCTRNNDGSVDTVEILLHPATGDDTKKQFVCMTLVFIPGSKYPEEPPEIEIRNPRGLGEEEIASLKEAMVSKADELKGEVILFTLIEMAKDSLTDGNIPRCPCVVCLEHFREQDSFHRTSCYHYFHSACLYEYLQHSQAQLQEEKNQGLERRHLETTSEDKTVICPMCRTPLDEESLSIKWDNVKKEENPEEFVLPPELRAQQLRMAEMYERQKARGGIIDLEQEKNKYLVNADFRVPIPVSTSLCLAEVKDNQKEKGSPKKDEHHQGKKSDKFRGHHYDRGHHYGRGHGHGKSHGHLTRHDPHDRKKHVGAGKLEHQAHPSSYDKSVHDKSVHDKSAHDKSAQDKNAQGSEARNDTAQKQGSEEVKSVEKVEKIVHATDNVGGSVEPKRMERVADNGKKDTVSLACSETEQKTEEDGEDRPNKDVKSHDSVDRTRSSYHRDGIKQGDSYHRDSRNSYHRDNASQGGSYHRNSTKQGAGYYRDSTHRSGYHGDGRNEYYRDSRYGSGYRDGVGQRKDNRGNNTSDEKKNVDRLPPGNESKNDSEKEVRRDVVDDGVCKETDGVERLNQTGGGSLLEANGLRQAEREDKRRDGAGYSRTGQRVDSARGPGYHGKDKRGKDSGGAAGRTHYRHDGQHHYDYSGHHPRQQAHRHGERRERTAAQHAEGSVPSVSIPQGSVQGGSDNPTPEGELEDEKSDLENLRIVNRWRHANFGSEFIENMDTYKAVIRYGLHDDDELKHNEKSDNTDCDIDGCYVGYKNVNVEETWEDEVDLYASERSLLGKKQRREFDELRAEEMKQLQAKLEERVAGEQMVQEEERRMQKELEQKNRGAQSAGQVPGKTILEMFKEKKRLEMEGKGGGDVGVKPQEEEGGKVCDKKSIVGCGVEKIVWEGARREEKCLKPNKVVGAADVGAKGSRNDEGRHLKQTTGNIGLTVIGGEMVSGKCAVISCASVQPTLTPCVAEPSMPTTMTPITSVPYGQHLVAPGALKPSIPPTMAQCASGLPTTAQCASGLPTMAQCASVPPTITPCASEQYTMLPCGAVAPETHNFTHSTSETNVTTEKETTSKPRETTRNIKLFTKAPPLKFPKKTTKSSVTEFTHNSPSVVDTVTSPVDNNQVLVETKVGHLPQAKPQSFTKTFTKAPPLKFPKRNRKENVEPGMNNVGSQVSGKAILDVPSISLTQEHAALLGVSASDLQTYLSLLNSPVLYPGLGFSNSVPVCSPAPGFTAIPGYDIGVMASKLGSGQGPEGSNLHLDSAVSNLG